MSVQHGHGEGAMTIVASFSFYFAFILGVGILIYTFVLSKRMHYSGALYKTTLYTGLSAFILGLHHLGEIILGGIPYGVEISESIEGAGAIFLLIATYNLYKIAKGVKQ
ncbi:MAG: hypothetical protein ACE5IH_04705 [Thermodesulfobacteriota bacterium]